MNKKTTKFVITALFLALTCVLTVIIRIPIVGTGGYVHLGDAMVIVSGVILGPTGGMFAAGIGAALADVVGGYFVYAPATLIIKGCVAWLTGMFMRVVRKKEMKIYPCVVFGGIADILFVCGGYYLYEIPFYGMAGAALSLPANGIQAASGLAAALFVCPVLVKKDIICGLMREEM